MKLFVEFLPPDISLTCFKHEGLKIEAFVSVIKGPYLDVSYEDNLISYNLATVDEAKSFADYLISEYLTKIRFVEEFFEGL